MRFRLALLVLVVLPCPAQAAPLSGTARAVDGDTIAFGRQRVRIWGIDAPERTQPCLDGSGQSWACGDAARAALARRIDGVVLTCHPRDRDDYGRPVASCAIGREDLARWIVGQGWAFDFARYSGGAYHADEQAARAGRRAIWAGTVMAPWLWRATNRRAGDGAAVTAPAPTPGCRLKGNINAAGARIVHAPGQRDYGAVRIDTGRGEPWFCTVMDARAAGWRPAAR